MVEGKGAICNELLFCWHLFHHMEQKKISAMERVSISLFGLSNKPNFWVILYA